MEPGRASSVLVIALTEEKKAQPRQQRLLEDALRLADWIGGLQGLPWYRDERGRLVVPREFPAAEDGRLMADPHAFPLAYLIPEADRARINGQYRAALRGGGVFDDSMQLRDATGALRNVRVVCMTRAPRGSGAVHMIIGTIAEARAGAASAVREAAGDLLARLPVLVWIVDDQGRVVHAQGSEPRRWGVRAAPSLRPQWDEAFEFKPESRLAVMNGIQKALRGEAAFDVVNARTSRSGGRLHLRSHFVPYTGAKSNAVMVLDTIASPTELLELDKLKRSKALYKSLVEASASLIWACDHNLTLTFVSRRAAREIYGYEPRDLLGRPVDVLLPKDVEQPAVLNAFDGAARGQADPRPRGGPPHAGRAPRHRVDQRGADAPPRRAIRRAHRHERRPHRAEVARAAAVRGLAGRAHRARLGRAGHRRREAGHGPALQRRVPAPGRPAARRTGESAGRRHAARAGRLGRRDEPPPTRRDRATRRWCASCASGAAPSSAWPTPRGAR